MHWPVKSRVKRVSQSAFRSDPQNIQSGKASLIEHLFGYGDNGRCTEGEVRQTGEKMHEKEKVRGMGERSARGVIIKVTHTLLNGSRLDHRQAGAMPPSDTKGCAGRGCHGGFN